MVLDQQLLLEAYRTGIVTEEQFQAGHEYGNMLQRGFCWECGEPTVIYPDEFPMCAEHWTRYPRTWQLEHVGG